MPLLLQPRHRTGCGLRQERFKTLQQTERAADPQKSGKLRCYLARLKPLQRALGNASRLRQLDLREVLLQAGRGQPCP